MYKIVLLPEAEKFYRGLYYSDRNHFARLAHALESLKADPSRGKPLKHNLKGKYSLRVCVYRILYIVQKQTVTIYVLDIDHRRDVYREK